jgi:hypothetical protein
MPMSLVQRGGTRTTTTKQEEKVHERKSLDTPISFQKQNKSMAHTEFPSNP